MGNRFAEVLGARTEAYVGRQLRLMAGADLYGEIEYRQGKDRQKSVDRIWVTPRAVILVECKSARLTLGARAAGDSSLPTLTERYLNDRSPVILPETFIGPWLDTALTDRDDVDALLNSVPEPHLVPYEVSTAVNSPRNNRPDLLIPVHR